jgi:hypothetical protein
MIWRSAQLTIAMIRRLHERLGISAEALIRPSPSDPARSRTTTNCVLCPLASACAANAIEPKNPANSERDLPPMTPPIDPEVELIRASMRHWLHLCSIGRSAPPAGA